MHRLKHYIRTGLGRLLKAGGPEKKNPILPAKTVFSVISNPFRGRIELPEDSSNGWRPDSRDEYILNPKGINAMRDLVQSQFESDDLG